MTAQQRQEEKRRLLAAYDAQLREGAEMASATSYDRAGPLWRGKFGDRGFVSYRSLEGYTGQALDALIARTVSHYAADPQIASAEWKTRGHDAPADLAARLQAHGFQPEEEETVMAGEARHLVQPPGLPEGVRVRRIDHLPDPFPEVVRAAEAQSRAFGFPFGVEDFLRRLDKNRGQVELWVAETAQEVVCVGRLEVVPGTEFAGLWGGGTLPEWRGRGIYRALTAARAQAALDRGVRYLYSDCTAYSRPILERSGLLPITTTTPYVWTRP
ncbi:GNAT family N-acetyltransferase [Deinococcus budaensis]|uniref:Ribosomal protein S18 acetylase RimI-like enzyme n=1 Tax=Deinococcus budaensis TaxID=1665626 RepID=A0A7W8LNV4_9DEIO|nr:GNAT family N-acetyltransferase [Deinococcus budaensis]MBB5233118.1 ribosomal protein S18 acetylase RimI-like enzyme [Deinococcus budaensis]